MGQLRSDMLDCRKGCINMAKVLETGPVRLVGQRPEVEDRVFNPANLKETGVLKPPQFWDLLMKHKRNALEEIFGEDLQPHGNSFVVRPGTGNASLGLLLPQRIPEIEIKEFDGRTRVRVKLFEQDRRSFLSITDLRFCEGDTEKPLKKAVENVSRRLRRGVKAILSVGLTRPWKKPDEDEEFHWLQVNNVHLEDDPAWRVE
jgi:hypothetical protein